GAPDGPARGHTAAAAGEPGLRERSRVCGCRPSALLLPSARGGSGAAHGQLHSLLAGSLASYMVTRAETQKCSDFWIYLETGTSPQEHRMADRVPQPAGGFCFSHGSPWAWLGSSLLRLLAIPAS
uniref:Uncharacterized protein n=1 Tax=Meleagris gallopavo TaxID=9103 RepID=A0A803XTD1_MELGA